MLEPPLGCSSPDDIALSWGRLSCFQPLAGKWLQGEQACLIIPIRSAGYNGFLKFFLLNRETGAFSFPEMR